jgi:hypothetical protein
MKGPALLLKARGTRTAKLADEQQAAALRDWAGVKAKADKGQREASITAKDERRQRDVAGIKDRENKLLSVSNTDPDRFQRDGLDREVETLRRQRGA